MNKIKTKNWKKYKVGDLFSATRGISFKMQGLDYGEVPVIAAARYNHGVAGYYNVKPMYKNAITISCNGVGCGSTYYHDYEFTITGDAIVLLDKINIPNGAKPFIASVYDKYFNSKYSYGDKCSADKAEAEIISLPSKDNKPDWKYMESYMKNIMQESEKNIENLQKISEYKNKIDVKNWKEFLLGGDDGLFNIVKGTRLTKANMKEGNINFIGSSAINNGVTNHISNSERVHPANLITVSYNGSIGEAFYQDEPFWASDDVNVFYPKFEQNFEIAMFLIPLIRKVGEKYKFVDKWKLEDMCNDKIKLPVNKNGEPDWEYIENYMKHIMQDTQLKLDKLVCC